MSHTEHEPEEAEGVGSYLIGLGLAILLTVVPPLLTDRDLRGLHDRASNTVVVRI